MIFKEVQSLRKRGDLTGAYAMAKNAYNTNHNDVWAKKALLMCIYEQLGHIAMFDTRDDFYAKLCELKEVNPEIDDISWNLTAYPIANIIRDTIQNNGNSEQIEPFFNRLFNKIKDFPYTKPSKEYSILLNSFIGLSRRWGNLYNFITWWGVSNLDAKDYDVTYYPDGARIRPLAERVGVTYAWEIISNSGVTILTELIDGARTCVGLLEDLIQKGIPAESSPKNQNVWFLCSRLHLLLCESDKATLLLSDFIEKNGDSSLWAIRLLADNIEYEWIRIPCYCRIYKMCEGKEDFDTLAIKEALVDLLLKEGNDYEAKYIYLSIRVPCQDSESKSNYFKAVKRVHDHYIEAMDAIDIPGDEEERAMWNSKMESFINEKSEHLMEYIHTLNNL